jgi:hypothetical protein
MPHLEIDNFAMAISLVASTRGVALLPVSAESFFTWSVISRPLKGEAPTIDLVIGYHKANTSPILRTFQSRVTKAHGVAIRVGGMLKGLSPYCCYQLGLAPKCCRIESSPTSPLSGSLLRINEETSSCDR